MHDDFVLEIMPDGNGGYSARVATSPRGPSIEFPLTLPWDLAEVESKLERWEGAVCRELDGESFGAASSRKEIEDLSRELSSGLSDMLFSGPAGGKLRASLSRLDLKRAQGWPLTLRIVLRDPQGDPGRPGAGRILALPWELLIEPRGSAFLSCGGRTTVVRSIGRPDETPPPPPPRPLRVLLVAASPTGTPGLALEREIENVRAAIDAVSHLAIVDLDAFQGGSLDDLRHILEHEPFHVIHFMGHGDTGDNGARGLVFERPDGSALFVPGSEIAGILARALPDLRLVLLNACRTGFGLADDLLRAGIPMVVAMQWRITDRMAIDFSTSFYEDLAAGFAVDTSVSLWREAASGYSEEWATPVVFANVENTRLFEPLPPTSRPSAEGGGQPLHLALRSWVEKSDQHSPAWGKASEGGADRTLSLASSFDNRTIRNPELWEGRVWPKLQRFLAEAAGGNPSYGWT